MPILLILHILTLGNPMHIYVEISIHINIVLHNNNIREEIYHKVYRFLPKSICVVKKHQYPYLPLQDCIYRQGIYVLSATILATTTHSPATPTHSLRHLNEVAPMSEKT